MFLLTYQLPKDWHATEQLETIFNIKYLKILFLIAENLIFQSKAQASRVLYFRSREVVKDTKADPDCERSLLVFKPETLVQMYLCFLLLK